MSIALDLDPQAFFVQTLCGQTCHDHQHGGRRSSSTALYPISQDSGAALHSRHCVARHAMTITTVGTGATPRCYTPYSTYSFYIADILWPDMP